MSNNFQQEKKDREKYLREMDMLRHEKKTKLNRKGEAVFLVALIFIVVSLIFLVQ